MYNSFIRCVQVLWCARACVYVCVYSCERCKRYRFEFWSNKLLSITWISNYNTYWWLKTIDHDGKKCDDFSHCVFISIYRVILTSVCRIRFKIKTPLHKQSGNSLNYNQFFAANWLSNGNCVWAAQHSTQQRFRCTFLFYLILNVCECVPLLLLRLAQVNRIDPFKQMVLTCIAIVCEYCSRLAIRLL